MNNKHCKRHIAAMLVFVACAFCGLGVAPLFATESAGTEVVLKVEEIAAESMSGTAGTITEKELPPSDNPPPTSDNPPPAVPTNTADGEGPSGVADAKKPDNPPPRGKRTEGKLRIKEFVASSGKITIYYDANTEVVISMMSESKKGTATDITKGSVIRATVGKNNKASKIAVEIMPLKERPANGASGSEDKKSR